MKAFLLAAGKGTRLRPYTDRTPKCLMPVDGKPLLQIWLELLARAGIRDVFINMHHLADQVAAFIAETAPQLALDITTAFEPVLLGSAGTLWRNRGFVGKEADFFIIYADNLTDMDLSAMIRFHRHRCRPAGGILTMGLFRPSNPSRCGIALLDHQRRIVNFVEKPEVPKSPWANAGIYVASAGLFDFFPLQASAGKAPVMDFGYAVLPRLVNRMYGYPVNAYWRDIGTVDAYHRALLEWAARSDVKGDENAGKASGKPLC